MEVFEIGLFCRIVFSGNFHSFALYGTVPVCDVVHGRIGVHSSGGGGTRHADYVSDVDSSPDSAEKEKRNGI